MAIALYIILGIIAVIVVAGVILFVVEIINAPTIDPDIPFISGDEERPPRQN